MDRSLSDYAAARIRAIQAFEARALVEPVQSAPTSSAYPPATSSLTDGDDVHPHLVAI